jgi:hypothetical protein
MVRFMVYQRARKKRHDIGLLRGKCVYLIDSANAVKIGFSTDISNRIRHLQIGCADRLRLVRVWYDGRARQIEALAHKFLKPYRSDGKGEWFCVEPALAVMVIDELFSQFPRNPANNPEPKMLLVCKACGHGGIVPYSTVGRFRCSNCRETRTIRLHAFPCQVRPETESEMKSMAGITVRCAVE